MSIEGEVVTEQADRWNFDREVGYLHRNTEWVRDSLADALREPLTRMAENMARKLAAWPHEFGEPTAPPAP